MSTNSVNTDPWAYDSLLVGGQGVTISSGVYQSIDIELTKNKDFQQLMERIKGIEDRLAILHPNWELQARFPALLEAYEHYKLIEKLVQDQHRNNLIK